MGDDNKTHLALVGLFVTLAVHTCGLVVYFTQLDGRISALEAKMIEVREEQRTRSRTFYVVEWLTEVVKSNKREIETLKENKTNKR